MKSLEDRFWNRVNKTDNCWLWTGYINKAGYGRLSVARRQVQAHRFAYELLIGPIPAGLHLDHLCRVHNCVRPDHLEPVTPRENILRGVSPTVIAHHRGRCLSGLHELSEENVKIRKYPNEKIDRSCRLCYRAWRRNRNKERRKNDEWRIEQNRQSQERYFKRKADPEKHQKMIEGYRAKRRRQREAKIQ